MERSAVVTGATTGIGEAFAEACAARGYNLLITGRRSEVISDVARRLEARHGVRVQVELADFGSRADLDRVAERVAAMPNVEILVNNAGACTNTPFIQSEWAAHETMLGCNALAVMRLTYAALPGMLARRKGDIINVSSVAAFMPFPTNVMYSATKSFINAFTETLAVELHATPLRLQALCPGMTRSNFHARHGLDPDKVYTAKGPMRAMTSAEVVSESLAALERRELFCVPGAHNRRTVFVARHAPRKLVQLMMRKLLAEVKYDAQAVADSAAAAASATDHEEKAT